MFSVAVWPYMRDSDGLDCGMRTGEDSDNRVSSIRVPRGVFALLLMT